MPFVCRFKVGLHIEVHNENLHWTPLSASTLFLPFLPFLHCSRRNGNAIQVDSTRAFIRLRGAIPVRRTKSVDGSMRLSSWLSNEKFACFAFYVASCLTMCTRSITGASDSKFDTNSNCEWTTHCVGNRSIVSIIQFQGSILLHYQIV